MPKNISTIISRLQKKDVSLHAKRFKKKRLMATDKVAYRLDIANEDLGARTCTRQSVGSTSPSCAIR